MSETKSGKSSLIPLLSRHLAQPAHSGGEGHEAAYGSAQLHIAEIAIAYGGHNYTFVNISYILLHLLLILQSYMCKSGLYTQLGSHIPILLDLDKDTYRTQPCLVTNLVMNLVTNLVITKFGDEFGDIFVTLFGDSPNLVMILMTFSSPHLVGHQIG